MSNFIQNWKPEILYLCTDTFISMENKCLSVSQLTKKRCFVNQHCDSPETTVKNFIFHTARKIRKENIYVKMHSFLWKLNASPLIKKRCFSESPCRFTRRNIYRPQISYKGRRKFNIYAEKHLFLVENKCPSIDSKFFTESTCILPRTNILRSQISYCKRRLKSWYLCRGAFMFGRKKMLRLWLEDDILVNNDRDSRRKGKKKSPEFL